MLGLDTSKHITKDDFTSLWQTAEQARYQTTWILCDLHVYASDNPDYDDLRAQIHNVKKLADTTLKKYASTIKNWDYDQRIYDLSIEWYYDVNALNVADRHALLQQCVTGKIETRDELRIAKKRILNQPLTETTTYDLPVIIGADGKRYIPADDIPDTVNIVNVRFERIIEDEVAA